MNSLERTNKLQEIAETPIEATWHLPRAHQKGPQVYLTFPYLCYFKGNTFFKNENRSFVEAGTLKIKDPELRDRGIGEQLTRSLGALAYKYHYPEIKTTVASEYMLDIYDRVFSHDRFAYYARKKDSAASPLPMEFDDVKELLVKMGIMEADPENRKWGIETTIDLTGMDMSSWEQPLEAFESNFDRNII